jgi:FAD/FMN-containing dehydrogenase
MMYFSMPRLTSVVTDLFPENFFTMTIDNLTTTVNGPIQLAAELRPQFSGAILVDGDTEYDQARKIWNGMIDRKPLIIARCTSTNDIQQAVKLAAKHGLLVSVKAGGHNVSGSAVCEGGIMIDVSQMKKVTVDPAEKTARAQAGATWGDFDKATQEFGLGSTGGLVSTTGVAGLTLGGGVGWLVRKHGMSCDNLIEAEVVLADGSAVTTNLEQHPDLLWALRGGSGNFGIASSMKFAVHEVSTVLGGMILHTRDKAGELIRFYRDFMKTAPNELTLYAALLTSPDGVPVVGFVGCYCGDMGDGEAAIRPLREFGQPVADLMQPLPYTQMQSLLDAGFPHGNRYYWKSGFIKSLTDEAIDEIIAQMATTPSPFSATIVEMYGGVAASEPAGGSAYPHRQNEFDLVIISAWQEPAEDDQNIKWARQIWQAVQPYLSNKVYVNTLGVEGEERVKEAYGDHYNRLVELKRKYDPANLFRMNQNIRPDQQ